MTLPARNNATRPFSWPCCLSVFIWFKTFRATARSLYSVLWFCLALTHLSSTGQCEFDSLWVLGFVLIFGSQSRIEWCLYEIHKYGYEIQNTGIVSAIKYILLRYQNKEFWRREHSKKVASHIGSNPEFLLQESWGKQCARWFLKCRGNYLR